MISSIYIIAFTIVKRPAEVPQFHDFITNNFLSCIKDHQPNNYSCTGISYRKDAIVQAFLDRLVCGMTDDLRLMKSKGAQIEKGVFKIAVDGEKDVTFKAVPEIEFVLQEMHMEYDFIATHFYYLIDGTMKRFVKMHTDISNIDWEPHSLEAANQYYSLLKSYFHGSDENEDEIAKLLLTWEAQ
jgi:hypothetical protein